MLDVAHASLPRSLVVPGALLFLVSWVSSCPRPLYESYRQGPSRDSLEQRFSLLLKDLTLQFPC